MFIVSGALNIFSLIIFVRIILSWFSGNSGYGRLFNILCGITDPYLNYFRRFNILRTGSIDFSPVAALAVLSIATNIVSTIARFGKISIGIIFALCLGIIWSALSFIIGFLIFILILRLAAYIFRMNVFTPFWRIIDTIAAPVQFRINRILFHGRIVHYMTGLIASIVSLALLGIVLGIFTHLLERFFISLPL